MQEIIARSAKNTLRSDSFILFFTFRALFKFTVDEVKSVDDKALSRSHIEFLNLLFGNTGDTVNFWNG